MAKLFDADGNEVEAFTTEELEAKKKEAIAEHLKNNPDKSAELKAAEAKAVELQKLIDEGGMSEGQKQRLKADKEAAEKTVKEITEKFTNEVKSLKEGLFGSVKKRLVETLSKGDKDVATKIQAKVDSLKKSGDYSDDEDGLRKVYTDAATLITGNKPAPNILDGASGGGSKGDAQHFNSQEVESENSKAMRKVFGISDENAKKYEKKA